MTIIILVIVMFSIFGLMGFITMKKIKSTDINNVDVSTKNNIKTAQEFLQFEEISDSAISLGQHQYRAIIKCSSINYELKSDKEQDLIELSFQRFLNSLSHPISFFIHTKTMDNTKMMEKLNEEISDVVVDFPVLEAYGNYYKKEMKNIYITIGNNKSKNKYIIVPYNEAISLTASTDEEKYKESIKELKNRCQIIIEGLQSMGIKSTILDTTELIDLLYDVNHKDNSSQSENIVNGDYLTLMVKGENKLADINNNDRLDWILYEAQLRLQTEITDDKKTDKDTQEKTLKVINEINTLRDSFAGDFKTDFNIEERIEMFK